MLPHPLAAVHLREFEELAGRELEAGETAEVVARGMELVADYVVAALASIDDDSDDADGEDEEEEEEGGAEDKGNGCSLRGEEGEEGLYERHVAWKQRSELPNWSATFKALAAVPKPSAFCQVCDQALHHAPSTSSSSPAASPSPSREAVGAASGPPSSSSRAALQSVQQQALPPAPLGFLTLRVQVPLSAAAAADSRGGASERREAGEEVREHRIAIPRPGSDGEGGRDLGPYARRVCLEVGAKPEECGAIEAELRRLQASLALVA